MRELVPSHPADCGCARCVGFLPGNDAALKHGSYVSTLRLAGEDRVVELAAEISATQPVSHPADAGAIQRLALVYRRIELSAAALEQADAAIGDKPGAAYVDGQEWLGRLREDHARWLREAGRIEAELARTRASRARLGLHLARAQESVVVALQREARATEHDAA